MKSAEARKVLDLTHLTPVDPALYEFMAGDGAYFYSIDGPVGTTWTPNIGLIRAEIAEGIFYWRIGAGGYKQGAWAL